MSHFTPTEIEYLNSQRLGRLATIGVSGEPHVVPTSFRYNPELDTIDIGGHGISKSKKYRDVQRGSRVAFVVDDVQLQPWQAHGIEVRGHAEVLPTGGKQIMQDFDPEIIRIHLSRIISWGIDGDPYHPHSRSVG